MFGKQKSKLVVHADHSPKGGDILCDLLQPRMHYNTLSGEMVGENIEGVSSGRDAKRKLEGYPATLRCSDNGHRNSKDLRPSRSDREAKEMYDSLQLQEDIESTKAFVDYEVIVPWVLRNMLLRAHALVVNTSSHHNYTDSKRFDDEKDSSIGELQDRFRPQAIQLLKELFEDCANAEKNYVHLSNSGDDPIYVSSDGLALVLQHLGIRVTHDVLKEVSLRYEYIGRVENAISDLDFLEYSDEYDDIQDELLLENIPVVADGKFNASLGRSYSSSAKIGDRKAATTLTRPFSRNKDNLSRTSSLSGSVRPELKRDFEERKHNPTREAESKLNKTWHHYINDRNENKCEYSEVDLKGSDDYEELEYDVALSHNRELRRSFQRGRRSRIKAKLLKMTKAIYVNVDQLVDDIESGDGLVSIDITTGSEISRRHNHDKYECRKNLLRAIYNEVGNGSDAKGALCAANGDFDFLYGECSLESPLESFNTDPLKGIEDEVRQDNLSALPMVVSIEGIIKNRREVINATDRFGCTPLHLAAASGQRDIVVAFIQQGADATASFQVIYSQRSQGKEQIAIEADLKSDSALGRGEQKNEMYSDLVENRPEVKNLSEPSSITPLSMANGPGVKSVLITALANRLAHNTGIIGKSASDAGLSHKKRTESRSLVSPTKNSEKENGSSRQEFELLSNLSQLYGHKFNLSRPALSWAVSVAAVDTVKQLLSGLGANPSAQVWQCSM